MKNCILTLLVMFFLSCTTSDKPKIENTELLGKWKVIETLMDPGDGSGTFQPIESNRIIEFFNNGTVTINGDFCFMTQEVGNVQFGTFTLNSSDEADTNYDGEIIPNNCEFSETKIYFNITANNELILWYLCIEGCGEKFIKIE